MCGLMFLNDNFLLTSRFKIPFLADFKVNYPLFIGGAEQVIMRVLVIILGGLLLLFQYSFWFGKNGYRDYQDVEQQIELRKVENTRLAQRNQLIVAEIKDLKEGVAAVEERARLEHDMVTDNEVFYRLMKADEYQ